jgi:hypothetical protein
VADLTPDQIAAMNMIRSGVNSNAGQGLLNESITATRRAAAYKPTNVAYKNAVAQAYGGAQLGPTAQAAIERLGNATQADAAMVDRAGIRDAYADQGLKYMQSYLNPYEDQVVQNSLNDLDRSRQMAIIGGEDTALSAGGYGGSRHGVADSLTNEAALRQAASMSGQLRQAGFNTAAGLGMTDADRAIQALLANQGVDLSTMTSNAGFEQQANLANAAAQNQYGLANATFGNQANQFNAGALNSTNIAQGNLTNSAGIASMQSANQIAAANAANALQAAMSNQSAGLQAANLGLSAGNALANLSTQQRTQLFENAGALKSVGDTQYNQNQKESDFAFSEWQREQNYPTQQLSALIAGTPNNLGSTTTQAPSQAAQWGQIISSLGPVAGPALQAWLDSQN